MKRSSGGIGRSEKQKRTKSYHCSKNRYGGSSPFSIQQGMAGILVMCTRTKEARAAKEAIDLFNQYADQFYPETISLYQQKDEENDKNEEEEKDEGDLEASIAKELEGLKDTKNNKERFTNISTGTDCMLFIKTCPEIEPAQFVHDILTDMAEKQIKKTRCISRILPVQRTCSANIPEMERVSKLVIHPQFNTKDDDGNIVPKVFSVVARLRNCTKLDRLDVVKAFATSIGPDHKVDLANPDYVILVDITRTICMMSVVKDFGKLRKYNLESLLGLNDVNEKKKKDVVKSEPLNNKDLEEASVNETENKNINEEQA